MEILWSYEKYVFQNLSLLQVFRALAHPHFLPDRFLRARSESTPHSCCSGGMQLRFGSRIWAQRLNQIQQRCLIPVRQSRQNRINKNMRNLRSTQGKGLTTDSTMRKLKGKIPQEGFEDKAPATVCKVYSSADPTSPF